MFTKPSQISPTHPTTSSNEFPTTEDGKHADSQSVVTSLEITGDPQPIPGDVTMVIGACTDREKLSTHYSSESDEDYSMPFTLSSDFEPSPCDGDGMLSSSGPDDDIVTLSSEEDQLMDTLPTIVCSQTQPYHQSLPFPGLSAEWYKRQNTLAMKNASREKSRHTNTPLDESGAILYISRSQVEGTLQENIQELTKCVQKAKDGSRNKKHMEAVLSVGKFIISKGVVVKTQDAGEVYKKEKGLTANRNSVELYEAFCKHLNISQVYLFGKAYVVQNIPGSNIDAVVKSLNNFNDKKQIVKEVSQAKLAELFKPAIQYMDTPRDNQVTKALIAELTNVSFASRLQGVHSRRGTTTAKKTLHSKLSHYQEIRQTSQMVRSDLTTIQQHKLTERVTSQWKLKEIKTIAHGRGRQLKVTQFPELAAVLCYAFGEYDVQEGGGGLEAHPRLTTGTLYRASDSATTMRKA